MPTWTTTLGDHQYDAVLAPVDPAAIARYRDERDALLARGHALDGGAHGDADRVTWQLLVERLAADAGTQVCRLHDWTFAAGSGSLLGTLSYLPDQHRTPTPADGDNLVARLGCAARVVDY